MWGMHEGMGWWMVLGSIWMVVFWAAIIWLVIRAFGQLTSGGRGDDTPLEIARRRYANGEITRDQFQQLQRDLAEVS